MKITNKKSSQLKSFLVDYILLHFLFVVSLSATNSKSGTIQNLISLPETETSTSITVLWNKPIDNKAIVGYDIYVEGSCVGYSKITNYTINGLKPSKNYSIYVVAKDANGNKLKNSNPIKVKTKPQGMVYNILDFGAKADSGIINTRAIQKAIDACTEGGVVVIPSGTFVSGALFLKSNMTLYIAKGGILKGSTNREDYMPFIKTRFEGWEFPAYASLITAGKLDETGLSNVKNISIRGEGKISGGGAILGKFMTDNNPNGARGRGRLICLMNCENVDIQGLTIEESPCWTIHYTYSRNVTCNGLNIISTAPNGDGIDPDSSINSYIFNCTFSTGDDCIAIKSGKNPEGNKVARPCENVYISNCNFKEGHGLSIGSEISGGIRNVQVIDCELGNLMNGLQIKTTEKRGGFIENVLVKDSYLQKITLFTSLPYNNDGESAATLTRLKNFEFTNLNMTNANIQKPVIYLKGFDDTANYAKNIKFKNIQLPDNSKIFIQHAENVLFENIQTVDHHKPAFEIIECKDLKY